MMTSTPVFDIGTQLRIRVRLLAHTLIVHIGYGQDARQRDWNENMAFDWRKAWVCLVEHLTEPYSDDQPTPGPWKIKSLYSEANKLTVSNS